MTAAAISIILTTGIVSLENAIEEQKQNIQEMREEKKDSVKEIQELKEKIKEWEEERSERPEETPKPDWEVMEAEVTAYAPTCPTAIEGMCYSGDPTITASGQEVEIGNTAAAGPDVPIGTKVWIEGFGWREVTDRGGAIGPGQFDVAVSSREEALNFGRQDRIVIKDKRRE